MRRFFYFAGFLGAAFAALWAVRLGLVVAPSWQPAARPAVYGVVHVHSSRSHDSRTSVQDIVREAQRQRLEFVVLTDHDAHTQPPIVEDDVVVLRETELSTDAGHLIALRSRPEDALVVAPRDDAPLDDGPQPSDLTRNLRDLAAVERFGLWPLVAHPDETKCAWHGTLPERGGVEVSNAAAQLRSLAPPLGLGLVPAALAFGLRKEALSWALYAAPQKSFARWDAHPSEQLVGLCGVDSHGWLPLKDEFSYWTVMLDSRLVWPRSPRQRPAALIQALQEGRFSCVAALGASRPEFAFALLDKSASAPRRLSVRLPQQAEHSDAFEIVLLREGEIVARGRPPELSYREPQPGLYRAEVWAQLPAWLWGTRPARVLHSQRIRVH